MHPDEVSLEIVVGCASDEPDNLCNQRPRQQW
jgi:hypothetical protein